MIIKIVYKEELEDVILLKKTVCKKTDIYFNI